MDRYQDSVCLQEFDTILNKPGPRYSRFVVFAGQPLERTRAYVVEEIRKVTTAIQRYHSNILIVIVIMSLLEYCKLIPLSVRLCNQDFIAPL